jgi:hypothetical protein
MTNPTDAASFVVWLTTLLRERKKLHTAIANLARAERFAQRERIKPTEDSILALVLDPLDLDQRDKPAPGFLLQAIEQLPIRFEWPQCVNAPERAWEYSLPTGASITYVPLLRERLIQLLAPLDTVLERKLAPNA